MNEGSPPRRVTLGDIARRLGVSQATVSLALHNDPQISAARRAEVARAAVEMGYRPDPMLSALNRYRHGQKSTEGPSREALAWINRWRRPEALREFREFDAYWLGAVEAASARGFHLEEIVWSPQVSVARLKQILAARGIRGVVIPPSERSLEAAADAVWTAFSWNEFSAVRLGRSIPAPGFPVVTADHVHNCRLAVGEMRRRGYERVGFVTSRQMSVFTLSLAGFLMAQVELPESAKVPPLVLTAEDRAGFQEWLAAAKPDAIFTDLPMVADWLAKAGRRVPADVGLAVTSVRDGGAAAGIDQQPHEIGRTAVEVLIAQLERHDTGIPTVGREMLIQGRWMDGASLPVRGCREADGAPQSKTADPLPGGNGSEPVTVESSTRTQS